MPQSNPVQRAFDTARQWVGAGGNSLVRTTQQLGSQAMRQAQRLGAQAQHPGSGVVAQVNAHQDKAVERSPQAQAMRQGAEAAGRAARRAAKVVAPLNPMAAIAAQVAGALSRTPPGQQLAKTPVAQAVQGLARQLGVKPEAAVPATAAEFQRNLKPTERADVAATARQIIAVRQQVGADRIRETQSDSDKNLLQGLVDGARRVVTGHSNDGDRALTTAERKLDQLSDAVMSGKIKPSEARRQLATTMKEYGAESTRVRNARVGQLDAGIAALQGVRGASESVATMTATTLAGPAGGVAVGTMVRDLNKAAYEASAERNGVSAPRQSLMRLGVDAARGQQVDSATRDEVLKSFAGSVINSVTDAATAGFSAARSASLLKSGAATGPGAIARASARSQAEAHLLFRAPVSVGGAALEVAQRSDMTLEQKAQHVGKAALGEIASLPFAYVGGGAGAMLDSGKTVTSALKQMIGDAVTGVADQAVRSGLIEGRAMTTGEFVSTVAGSAVGGLNNFSQHPQAEFRAGEMPGTTAGTIVPTSPTAERGGNAPSVYDTLREAGVPTTLTPNQVKAADDVDLRMMAGSSPDGAAAGGDTGPTNAPAPAVRRFITDSLTDALRRGLREADVEVDGQLHHVRLEPGDSASKQLRDYLEALPAHGRAPVVHVSHQGALVATNKPIDATGFVGRNIGGYLVVDGLNVVVSPEGAALGARIGPKQLLYVDKHAFWGQSQYLVKDDKNYYTRTSPYDLSVSGSAEGARVITSSGQASVGLKANGFKQVRDGVWIKDGIGVLVDADRKLAAVFSSNASMLEGQRFDRVAGHVDAIDLSKGKLTYILGKSDGMTYQTLRVDALPSMSDLGIRPLNAQPLDPIDFPHYEARMRPGRSASDDGFLGPDESLRAVLEADQRSVDRLGVTHLQLASLLQLCSIMSRRISRNAPSDQALPYVEFGFNQQRFRVYKGTTWAGSVASPIDGSLSNNTFPLVNLTTGKRIDFNGIHPHLIARGFYEGMTRLHRIAPEQIVEIFAGNQPTEQLIRELDRLGIPRSAPVESTPGDGNDAGGSSGGS